MHDWIFERRGAFTDREIETAARQAGLDPALFLDVMQGPQTAALVADDVTEGRSLGIRSTPMIFLNGVELKEYTVENALGRAVDALAEALESGQTLEHHAPPTAREKFVADWRDQPAYDFSDVGGWGLGPADAPVQIVVWGDTTQSQTRDFDAHLTSLMAGATDIRYVFLEYPLEKTCREAATFTVDACMAPAIAVAAGQLGGADAFWAAHRWLCEHEGPLNGGLLTRVGSDAGLDPAALAETLGTDAVASTIAANVARAQAVKLGVLPGIFINGKWVPRWRSQHHLDIPILQLIIDEARASP
jgi:protein-disulfide isomerase